MHIASSGLPKLAIEGGEGSLDASTVFSPQQHHQDPHIWSAARAYRSMDWIQDGTFCDREDLDNVFRYMERPTTVVRVSPDDSAPLVWTMENEYDWDDWFKNQHPALGGLDSGLVLILAKRAGEQEFPSVKGINLDDWIKIIRETRASAETTAACATLAEKPTNPSAPSTSGRRTLRILPFSRDSFRKISKKFYIHSSMARIISRADTPAISVTELEIGEQNGEPSSSALVYGCRTSNAWGGDLALSTTHFPHRGLTFAVVFGCSVSVEVQVLQRLKRSAQDAFHPLLMPGIFVELERLRHIGIVESTIDDLETRIQELDVKPEAAEALSDEEKAIRNSGKRSAWLDTMYLRNQLISWTKHLEKLIRHVDDLSLVVFSKRHSQAPNLSESTEDFKSWPESLHEDDSTLAQSFTSQGSDVKRLCRSSESFVREYGLHSSRGRLPNIGHKFKDRIQDIIGEYDEKIRDCTMRVDGMAMATQWARGETNMEIAMATRRDSRHMRSIALVTMIFLPGTFFAGVFSMDFFDWSGSNEDPVVSKYLWIYVVMAVTFTLLTLGCWWYFGVHRNVRRHKSASEAEVPIYERA